MSILTKFIAKAKDKKILIYLTIVVIVVFTAANCIRAGKIAEWAIFFNMIAALCSALAALCSAYMASQTLNLEKMRDSVQCSIHNSINYENGVPYAYRIVVVNNGYRDLVIDQISFEDEDSEWNIGFPLLNRNREKIVFPLTLTQSNNFVEAYALITQLKHYPEINNMKLNVAVYGMAGLIKTKRLLPQIKI